MSYVILFPLLAIENQGMGGVGEGGMEGTGVKWAINYY